MSISSLHSLPDDILTCICDSLFVADLHALSLTIPHISRLIAGYPTLILHALLKEIPQELLLDALLAQQTLQFAAQSTAQQTVPDAGDAGDAGDSSSVLAFLSALHSPVPLMHRVSQLGISGALAACRTFDLVLLYVEDVFGHGLAIGKTGARVSRREILRAAHYLYKYEMFCALFGSRKAC
jgi:hypothetical protein